jgi:xanthine dehydrogenase accessory factor
MQTLGSLKIIMRGAGDLATGVALRLYGAGFSRLLLLETDHPLAVRRLVSFSEAVALDAISVEGVRAVCKNQPQNLQDNTDIVVLVDPRGENIAALKPDVVIDAIMAKKNLGTTMDMAPLVIGLGPGFTAGTDVHCVIETMRGHTLGRVIRQGAALADTGVPGSIGGYTEERLLRAPADGMFTTECDIGDRVAAGDQVAAVDGKPVIARISGVLRGLLRNNTPVGRNTKLGDIDPRGKSEYCHLVSDKALAIGGGVLEAIAGYYNRMEH